MVLKWETDDPRSFQNYHYHGLSLSVKMLVEIQPAKRLISTICEAEQPQWGNICLTHISLPAELMLGTVVGKYSLRVGLPPPPLPSEYFMKETRNERETIVWLTIKV